ncbi:hypothetical protein CA13_70570 [Planctomycetes bacterium CA13]|uniref:Uncharacterized protein n=1 Tax=Novipirellula herctigrandis TaxID=2527986 RepID=A0A5C5YNN0_9BACT|nr:hypothetical protein CA13_70570 [Planctomycetes bacterium CA13]
MPKFYVQCGPIETILDADSPRSAAMNALDQMLQTHLWIYDDCGLSENDCQTHLMLEALMHLEPSVQISEKGFNRHDAICLGTPETVHDWHRLMIGMKRLFVAAGLTTRSMASVGLTDTAQFVAPQMPR